MVVADAGRAGKRTKFRAGVEKIKKGVSRMFHGYFISDVWWIFPLLMIVMCVFIMSRGCIGCMMGRHVSEGMKKQAASESALDILNKRYARGEIDKNEYEAKKSVIVPPG